VKALTLHEPWASLVSHGFKTIETRSWQTKYRGPLAIHASKKRFGFNSETAEFVRTWSVDVWRAVPKAGADPEMCDNYPLGCVVATAHLDDVVPTDPEAENGLMWSRIWNDDPEEVEFWASQGWWRHGGDPVAHTAQRRYGDFAPGRWAWLLSDVMSLVKPVPVKGALGLWNFEMPGHVG
jgi:hypothetical protein